MEINMDKKHLLALLKISNVSLGDWGTGAAKTVDHLLKEINDGESTLIKKGNFLLRSVTGSSVRIFYKQKSSALLFLKEDKQIFKDGREKRRELAGNMSIGEKLKFGEIPAIGAWRALAEELGVTEKLPLVPRPNIIKGPIPSISFPGLYTLYSIYAFEVFLPEKWYKPEGYAEKQADKTNYFIWEEIL